MTYGRESRIVNDPYQRVLLLSSKVADIVAYLSYFQYLVHGFYC